MVLQHMRIARPVSQKWHIDETYINIKGQWHYLYRAIDSNGNTVDFLLTRHRDILSAKRFFRQAINHHPCPLTVIMDKYAANHCAVDSFNVGFRRYKPITIRQNKYLNNRIEQDHRRIKRRTKGMLGFKAFRCAQILLSCIELMHMLRKNQVSVTDESPRSRADQFLLLVALS